MPVNRQRRARRKPVAEINVVPYIDVMLVLLVIFMITAPLLSQGVEVDLPKASVQAMPTKQAEPIVVSVDSRGRYYLNVSSAPTKPIAAAQLVSQVSSQLQKAKAKHQTRDVYVKGDQYVGYGKVMQAMVLLQQAGASSVGLIARDSN